MEPWTDGVVSKGLEPGAEGEWVPRSMEALEPPRVHGAGVEPVKGLDQRSRMVGGSTFRHLGALRFWGAMVEDSSCGLSKHFFMVTRVDE